MGAIDNLLANNIGYAATQPRFTRDGVPALGLAIVTCMDARLDVAAVLGLREGDAHVLRNAGGAVTDDVIRSLAISQRRLQTREIMLIHHTHCGMQTLNNEEFSAELEAAAGIAPPFAIEAFANVDRAVRERMVLVRESPFLLYHNHVRGFVYDVETHSLREVFAEDDG